MCISWLLLICLIMVEIYTFFNFTHVHRTFWYNFKGFFNKFEISMKFSVFLFLFWRKFFLWYYVTQKTAQNKYKKNCKCILDFNLAPSKGLGRHLRNSADGSEACLKGTKNGEKQNKSAVELLTRFLIKGWEVTKPFKKIVISFCSVPIGLIFYRERAS